MHLYKRRTWSALVAVCIALAAPVAKSQAFPSKAVTILLASTPGGPLDASARMVAQHLSSVWGVSVLVDYRPGAGGTIAAGTLARAPADGHTLMISTRAVVINPSLYSKLPFDTETDIAPVALINEQPNLLVVSKDFPAKTVPELLKLLQQNPGKYTYGSAGHGGIPHMAAEMFMQATGFKLVHIPYKGAASLMTDLLGGRVDMTFSSPGTSISQISVGKVIPIAIAAQSRTPLMPNIPTFAEFGVKNFSITSWYGLFAPSKTPQATLRKINSDLNSYLKSPDTVKRFATGGSVPRPLTLEEFNAEFKRDLQNFAKLLRDLDIKVD